MGHYLAWLVWTGAAAVAVAVTRNPLYLALLVAGFNLVAQALRRASPAPRAPFDVGRFALVVIPASAGLNALTAHVGTRVFLRLPEGWPLIGGPLTLESLLYGAINGLVLTALLAAFQVFNAALATRDLIRLVPRAFHPVAVVLSIAVTFIPATLRQLAQIREAQAIRGHRMRGARDWLPLFMPLLVGGLERALRLAEAMTARGFAGDAPPLTPLVQAGTLAGLGMALVGLVLRLSQMWPAVALALILAGSALVVGAVAGAGRRATHTVYRQTSWSARDGMGVGCALAALLPLALNAASRTYTPYPTLTWPPFDSLTGLALLGFAAPAFLLPGKDGQDSQDLQDLQDG